MMTCNEYYLYISCSVYRAVQIQGEQGLWSGDGGLLPRGDGAVPPSLLQGGLGRQDCVHSPHQPPHGGHGLFDCAESDQTGWRKMMSLA